MKAGLGPICLLLVMGIAGEAHAASITVKVTGVRDDRGVVRVAVCPRADFLHPHCPYFGHSPSKAGSVVVTIDQVPPGVYAAQAYQDANNAGVLQRNWLGLPKDGMGFSNNAPMRFGPPAFDEAAFVVGTGAVAISFRLIYIVGPGG